MFRAMSLLAVPNLSEGRDETSIQALADAFGASGRARLLDRHSDPDHQRTVFTLAGAPGELSAALFEGARMAVERIDIGDGRGLHPHVGAIDVVPVVYLDRGTRGGACAEALVVAARIGEELQVPVFLYGELAGGTIAPSRAASGEPRPARTRAQLRRGGPGGLARRIADGESRPDFGPNRLHPTAGATLVAARPPLVAFNLELAAPATVKEARAIAARIREGGAQGLPGVRAIGLELSGGVAQVSMNVERPLEVSLGAIVEAVREHTPLSRAELVGLAPRAALEGFPADLAMPGFDPRRHVIENVLALARP